MVTKPPARRKRDYALILAHKYNYVVGLGRPRPSLCVGLRDEPDYETNGQAARLNKKAPTFKVKIRPKIPAVVYGFITPRPVGIYRRISGDCSTIIMRRYSGSSLGLCPETAK